MNDASDLPGIFNAGLQAFQQARLAKQQRSKQDQEQQMEAEKLKAAQFGNSSSLGATDASLGLPSAGLPEAGKMGPTAPRPINNANALPFMEKQLLAQEAAKNRQAQLDAAKITAGDKTASFSANQLRDEFNNNSKDFLKVLPAFKNIISAADSKNPSAASDMRMIFSYMKLLDPNSTVREGEYATAQNAASVSEKARNAYNKALSGQFLDPAQRLDFKNEAIQSFKDANSTQGIHMKRYTDLASKMKVDPSLVVYDYGAGILPQESAGGQHDEADIAAAKQVLANPKAYSPEIVQEAQSMVGGR